MLRSIFALSAVAGSALGDKGFAGPAPLAPAGFDCKTRHLAMEYARKIQPFRSKADFDILAEVLDMHGGAPGGPAQCFNVTYDGPDQTFTPTFPIPASGTTVYADSASGKDTNPGTLAAPFATIGAALAATRKAAKGGASSTIALRKGVYYGEQALNLTAADSGLTIQNYDGEEAWLSGAKKLKAKWTAGGAEHPRFGQAGFDAKAVWKTDLSGQGVKVIEGLRIAQDRAVRARFPNGCTPCGTPGKPECKNLPSNYLCQGFQKGSKVVDPNDGFGSNLFLSDDTTPTQGWIKPTPPDMHQKNWQEVNPPTPLRETGLSFQKFQLGVGGSCGNDPMDGGVGFTPPAGYWCGSGCEGGAPKPPGCISRWPRGFNFNQTILPNSPYKNAETGVVQVWHPGHWASWMFDIVSKNDKATTDGKSEIAFGKGGFQGARGSYGNSGMPAGTGRMADSFFVENVFEELDTDNEFFYDESTSTLYYYSSEGAPVGDVEMTLHKTFVSIVGTQEAPVRNVRLLGVGMRDTAISYLDAHSMPSGGDWGLGRIAAVFIKGAVGTVIDSCAFQRLDGNAVMINGYARGTVIQNSNFHEIGDNIIAQLGETTGAGDVAWGMGPDGTAGNQPVGTIVKSNFAYRCGLFEKQSSFYFQAKSHANIIKENIFFHGPRAGMNFNDGFGGGSTLEGNFMVATVMESGDHGPFNSWDRQVWEWMDDSSGVPVKSIIKKYDEIKGNFFIGNYYGQEPIDNDDGSAYYNTHHNFFAYGGQSMKNDFNGHDNHHHHNIYGYMTGGMGICGALPGHADQFYSNKIVLMGKASYAQYDCKCNATGTCPTMHDNQIYVDGGQFPATCGETLAQRQAKGVDMGTAAQPLPSDEMVIEWARELLSLPASKNSGNPYSK